MIGTGSQGKFSYITDTREKPKFEQKLNAAVKRFYGFQRPLKQVPVTKISKFNKTKSWDSGMSSASGLIRSKSFNIKAITSSQTDKEDKNKTVRRNGSFGSKANLASFSSKTSTKTSKKTKSILKTSKTDKNLEHERITVGPFRLPSSRTTSYRKNGYIFMKFLLKICHFL